MKIYTLIFFLLYILYNIIYVFILYSSLDTNELGIKISLYNYSCKNQIQILGWLVSYIPMQMVQAYKQNQAIVHGSFVDPQLQHNVVDYKTIQMVQECKQFICLSVYFIVYKSEQMVQIYNLVFFQSLIIYETPLPIYVLNDQRFSILIFVVL